MKKKQSKKVELTPVKSVDPETIKELGLRTVEAQLQYLRDCVQKKRSPKLPTILSIDDTISAFEMGIEKYKKGLLSPR